MKFNYDKTNKQVVISVNFGLLMDQVITTAVALAFVGGIFWFAPEQLGW